jgi:small multidrug resistance pump
MALAYLLEAKPLAWLLLAASVTSEVAGTVALRQSDGLSRVAPSVAAGVCYVLAVWWMSLAMKHIGMGTTYAVWAGSGLALTALLGVALFGEPLSGMRLAGLALVVAGVVTLSLAGPAH